MEEQHQEEVSWKECLQIMGNAEVFVKINRSKKCFIHLLSEVSNQLMAHDLEKWHSPSQGTKISQGNSLQQCPYQVLDIIRDFNPQSGLNIRVLNWWGRGIYLFLFLGKQRAINYLTLPASPLLTQLRNLNYRISLTDSPWDYKGMVDKQKGKETDSVEEVKELVNRIGHVQVFKKLAFKDDQASTEAEILNEIVSLGNTVEVTAMR